MLCPITDYSAVRYVTKELLREEIDALMRAGPGEVIKIQCVDFAFEQIPALTEYWDHVAGAISEPT